MTQPNDQAYPFTISIPDPDAHPSTGARKTITSLGLTKREYFAGKALEGILGSSKLSTLDGMQGPVARVAVSYADALIEALKEEEWED